MKPIAARPSLATEVAAAIRQEILDGRLKAGERLVESRLATTLGVSRAPVREALKLLSGEGLVSEEPNRGACVISLTEDDVREIYDLRAALEVRAARLLARTHRTDDAIALRRRVEDMEKAASADDASATSAADLAFHTSVLERTRNGRLLESFNRAVPVLRALIPLDESCYPSLSEAAEEHWRLVLAIEAGDESAAARCAQEHVENGLTHVVGRWLALQAGAEG
jgi:DNA-binding GntR family transcriptional regulator